MNLVPPVIIAHRGFRKRYPENTLASFEAAVTAGAHMLELDVTLTRDRSMVVIHDDTLDRTTSGSGVVRRIDLAEIADLDAGSWFSPEFRQERIPLLETVVDSFVARIAVNIEIKASAMDAEMQNDGIEQKVIALLQRHKATRNVVISSFEPRILERIHKIDASIPLGLLTEAPDAEQIHFWREKIPLFSWHPDAATVSRRLVQEVKDGGLAVFTHTVNQVSQARELLQIGADGFFTDDTAAMVQAFQ